MNSIITPVLYKSRESQERINHRQSQYYSKVARERLRNRRIENKLEFVKRLGGKCSICGWDGHFTAFEFDHIDRDNKNYNIGKILGWINREDAWEEVKKCRLLCSNCHRIETFENNHYGSNAGHYARDYKWGGDCPICGKPFKSRSPLTKYCSPKCKDKAQRIREKNQ